ncbi:MAG: hypothetical protein GXY38_11550 [Planctomycetes bacterium]|nr:hypothetical protein [Planctomycetota bacterium]
MPYKQIDPMRIQTLGLNERESLLDIRTVAADPSAPAPDAPAINRQIDLLAARIAKARANGASVMLAYGAHLIKNGGGPLLIELMRRGLVTHLATQGAGIVHDWEFAHDGRSSEDVRTNVPLGRFGTWSETGVAVNLSALAGATAGMGLGESIGRFVLDDGVMLPDVGDLKSAIAAQSDHPLTAARADLLQAMTAFGLSGGKFGMTHRFKQSCVCAQACAMGVPLTVHPGIGYDIYANHPMFSGSAIGRTSQTDARVFAAGVLNLSGGVYLSVGSAIMSPQIFEKALSLANNLRIQDGLGPISGHSIAIVDIQNGGGWDWSRGEPPKDNPAYYLRFCKSFHRMGGAVDYLCGDNVTILHCLLKNAEAPHGNAGT